jgi:carbon-monoxide dehydrogenase small subunit
MAASNRKIHFTLNGIPAAAEVSNHENLVELVRRFDLTGARESCGQGLCGCCTVIVDEEAVSGCLYPAVLADAKAIRTIEGLEQGDELHPIQQAFIEEGAFQCGFCTPGFILMVERLLQERPQPSDDDIRGYLSGNLCRCAAYPEIVRAVRNAAKRLTATVSA